MSRQLWQSLPLILILSLVGCGGNSPNEGESGFVEGFFGGIMVDEPRAALIGRDVLSAGGNAADAVVAAYFTAAVTMPGGAGLGGGGLCLAYDPERNKTEALEFLARVPASAGPGATVAVPGNMRGMALLQARYGRLNWSDLLIPAENYAREGHAISRAFANELAAAAPRLADDAEARRIFGLDGGDIVEGRSLRQVELAAVLSVLRTRGAGEFYGGQLGRKFAAAVDQAGGALSIDDLRDYHARLLDPVRLGLGDNEIYFPPTTGGVLTAQVWAAGRSDGRYADADAGQRIHLLAEVGARAYAAAQRADQAPDAALSDAAVAKLLAGYDSRHHKAGDRASAPIVDDAARGRDDGLSIVAVDLRGQAVACSFSLNRPFGVGRIAPGTGMFMAAAPSGVRASEPSAVMVANTNSAQMFFGAAISGGSPAVLAAVALDTFATDRDFGAAVARPRAYDTGNPDVIIAEPELGKAEQKFLDGAGDAVEKQGGLGQVNGFHCPQGLPRRPTCKFVADPRGSGLAVSADEK